MKEVEELRWEKADGFDQNNHERDRSGQHWCSEVLRMKTIIIIASSLE